MNAVKTKALPVIGALTASLYPVLVRAESDLSQCKGAQAVGGSCSGTEFSRQITAFINTAFFIAGTLAVIIIIIAGVMYIASTGDGKRIEQAKNTLFYAVAGLVVVIFARLIVGFIIGRFA